MPESEEGPKQSFPLDHPITVGFADAVAATDAQSASASRSYRAGLLPRCQAANAAFAFSFLSEDAGAAAPTGAASSMT